MVVKSTDKEIELLARLMRAEAVGEGNLGMLMVGNVGINRVLANCLTFKEIDTISQMVFQSPGGVYKLVQLVRSCILNELLYKSKKEKE